MDTLPAALLDAAFYPHPADSLCLIETHVSWIALAGDFAYKVKRPVRLPFLDYGTLTLRRAACATEVALNRRWAPELYLGVSEIVVTADGLRLDQAGTPFEPCVRMRRFDRALELDALIARHSVDPAELAALGGRVAAWQSAAPAAAADLPLGRPQDVLAAADGTFASLAAQGSPVAGRPSRRWAGFSTANARRSPHRWRDGVRPAAFASVTATCTRATSCAWAAD